ncbi:RNase H domain-containing protein [Nephila pilipes]|uniref:RNase H domain-containing protein n=1 Tax=Nephila pilipes TaxID=299642 RepID=A0A8X6Q2P2_NEPPI|nr:RNase H domain-containing protein [Nephila pilipes]
MPPIDSAILNNPDVQESFLSTSLGTLDGAIPISLLPYPSCRKPITLVTYSNEVLQNYKTICFTDGSKLNGGVGLACVIYVEGFEKATFQHRIRDECSVFQAELLCIDLAVKSSCCDEYTRLSFSETLGYTARRQYVSDDELDI